MQMNSQIPFMGVVPDYVNALAMGQGAAMQRNEGARQNALAEVYRTQGPGILAGEQGALNALAGVGEVGQAMGVMDTRQGMEARDLQMQATRQDMRLQAQQWAAQLSAQDAAEAREGIGRAILMMQSADTPEAWDAMAQQLGKPELMGQFAKRDQRLIEVLPFAEALDFALSQNAPQETSFIVSGENEYGLDPRGQYNVTAGPSGVQATPIGSIPSASEPNADERAIALLQEIQNPQSGQNYTREEAIRVTQLYQISRDPVTGEVVVVNRADGQPVGQQTAQAQPAPPPAGSPLPAVPPPPADAFNLANPAARQAFGMPGFLGNLANTVSDTLGQGQVFPELAQARADFDVMAESILNRIASAYDRPPAFVMSRIEGNIPKPGSITQGPESAINYYSALRRDALTELQAVTQQLSQAITPTQRSSLELRASVLSSSVQQLDGVLTELSGNTQPRNGENPSGTTSTGLTWRIIE